MRKFMVFCLSTVGALTMLAVVAATGAVGLYYLHGDDGRESLLKVQVVTETADGKQVYDILPGRGGARSELQRSADGATAEKTVTPAPASVLAVRGPSNAAIAELKVRLAAALQRIAELEAERQTAAPTPPKSTPAPAGTADF